MSQKRSQTYKVYGRDALRLLATRIPLDLKRRMQVHCIEHDCSLADFIVAALLAKLGKPPMGNPVLPLPHMRKKKRRAA